MKSFKIYFKFITQFILKKYRIFLGILLGLLILATKLINPVLLQQLIDKVMMERKISLLLYIVIGIATSFLVEVVTSFFLNKFETRISVDFSYNARTKVIDHYLQKNVHDIKSINLSEIELQIVNDINKIQETLKGQLISRFVNFTAIVVYIIVCLSINYKLFLMTFITIPLTYFIGFVIGKGMSRINDIDRNTKSEYRNWLNITLPNWVEIKGQSVENIFKKENRRWWDRLADIQWKWIRYWFFSVILSSEIKKDLFSKLLLYFVGGFLVLNGSLSIGVFILFTNYFSQLFIHVDEVVQSNIQLGEIKVLIEKLNDIAKKSANLDEEENRTDGFEELEARAVTFSYDDISVLNNFNYQIEKGDKILLSGKSGTGKTTLLSLFLRLNQPSEGELYLNKKSYSELTDNYLYTTVGGVLQSSVLFDLTVKENLELADPSLRKLTPDLLEIIDDLEFDGVPIGQYGENLSAGQRKRLLFVQTILKSAHLIVLDEPTANLDAQIKEKVRNYIKNDSQHNYIISSHDVDMFAFCNKMIKLS